MDAVEGKLIYVVLEFLLELVLSLCWCWRLYLNLCVFFYQLLFKGVYHLDHEHFDLDFDNCILLTNEHIQRMNLEEQDLRFFQLFTQDRIETQVAGEMKRKESRRRWTQAKRQRIMLENDGQ